MPRQMPASYRNVQDMAEHLKLSAAAYQRASEIAGLKPDRACWLRYIDHFLIAVGAALIVAGIAAFFAWNWADLKHMAKFALIEVGIVAAVLITWRLGIDSIAGRASLFSAAFLTGTLLAVYGQVYQTGADPYGLFLTWAVLILPWAIIGRQAGIWLLLLLLLNLTLIMYYTQVLHPPEGWWQLAQLLGPLVWLGTTVMDSTLASYLFALNAVALVIWEAGAYRRITWMQGRVYPGLVAVAALGTVLIPTLVIIVVAGFEEVAELSMISPALLFVATVACMYYYQYQRHDLFILTCSLFGVIMVITSFAIRNILWDVGSFLVLAFLVMAQVAGAAWWLRQVARRWEQGP